MRDDFVITAIVATIVALKVGEWRHYCRFLQADDPAWLPLVWHQPAIQHGSFVLVAASAVWAAGVFSVMIGNATTTLIGHFSFGGLLTVRWIISGLLAFSKSKADIARWKEQVRTWQQEESRKSRADHLLKDNPLYKLISTPTHEMTAEQWKEYAKFLKTLRTSDEQDSDDPSKTDPAK